MDSIALHCVEWLDCCCPPLRKRSHNEGTVLRSHSFGSSLSLAASSSSSSASSQEMARSSLRVLSSAVLLLLLVSTSWCASYCTFDTRGSARCNTHSLVRSCSVAASRLVASGRVCERHRSSSVQDTSRSIHRCALSAIHAIEREAWCTIRESAREGEIDIPSAETRCLDGRHACGYRMTSTSRR